MSTINRAISYSAGGLVHTSTVLFTEDATSTTHTGTITIPSGALLLDILVWTTVLWTDSSAALTVGDSGSANGWFLSTQLDTTDLLVRERFQAAGSNNWGGLNGAYLTTAGIFGPATGAGASGYYPDGGSIIGVVAVSTPSGTAGRTFMSATYMNVSNYIDATTA